MVKVIHREIRVSVLPRAWASELDVAPDVMVRVTRPRRDIRTIASTDQRSQR
jgi:hypothetical protein